MAEGYAAGKTLRELAREFGIGREQVPHLLRRHGVQLRDRNLTPAMWAEAISLYAAGSTTSEIAEQMGRDSETIRLGLHRHGVKMRRRWD
jgi:predicted transcriptional regulator